MISVIVPTLGNREAELKRLFKSFQEQTNKNFEVILVTQENHDCIDYLKTPELDLHHIKLNKKGLSYARNRALEQIKGSIVTFSDDDCWYPPDSMERVENAFTATCNDIIVFQIYDPISKKYYKEYKDSSNKKVFTRDIFRISSIEFFLKAESLKKAGVFFDEDFGLGTNYPSGEENVFIYDLFKSGLKIQYFPEVIVYHKKPETNSRLTEPQLKSKGPLFKRLFSTPIALILLFLFFLKKRRHINQPFNQLALAIREAFIYKKNGGKLH
ncbi:glycosyltransferase family 2 protein [Metabacillus indicus]|nr:glycosyltransferase family A protein [Metabacillus indicus]